ncbi:MAG: hypothetical protein J5855_09885 [Mailhella sp.]|nr:hypothetical protein [Mailhella sp.]
MKKLLLALILCAASCMFHAGGAAAKDAETYAYVVDVKFAMDAEGSAATYFMLKEDDGGYDLRHCLNGKTEYFKINIDPGSVNPDDRISEEEAQPLFWVLHIIANHFVGTEWRDMPFYVRLDLQKKEIRQIHFVS